jgi:hypothetical protein
MKRDHNHFANMAFRNQVNGLHWIPLQPLSEAT